MPGIPDGQAPVSLTPRTVARENPPLTPEQRAALVRLAGVLKAIAARRLASHTEQEARHAG